MASEKERVAIVSMVASALLAAAKFAVGVWIGSLALITDALHSLIDFGATVVTLAAVRVSDRPPDDEHHYGHGKVESLAALVQTVLLLLVAGGVAVEAASRLQVGGTPVTFSIIPFALLGVEMAVNAWRALALKRMATKTSSQALEGDALHFASDFFGSIPVLIGLTLSAYGYHWGDPAAALVVAALVAVLGVRLGRRTIQTLLDEAPRGAAERVLAAIGEVPGVVGVERVRLRQVGPRHFVDAAVRVPRTYPMERVSDVRAGVQAAVAEVLRGADVTVTTTPVALDDETVQERIFVIARNRALAVHHVTVHQFGNRLAIALDLEVDGAMPLGDAHVIASELEHAIAREFGGDVEVETHIEPLQTTDLDGVDCEPAVRGELIGALSSLLQPGGPLSDVHNVRARETAAGLVLVFHCRADPALPVAQVHEAVDALERRLKDARPQVRRVIGHAEPRR